MKGNLYHNILIRLNLDCYLLTFFKFILLYLRTKNLRFRSNLILSSEVIGSCHIASFLYHFEKGSTYPYSRQLIDIAFSELLHNKFDVILILFWREICAGRKLFGSFMSSILLRKFGEGYLIYSEMYIVSIIRAYNCLLFRFPDFKSSFEQDKKFSSFLLSLYGIEPAYRKTFEREAD